MTLKFHKTEYFYAGVKDETGEGFRFLSRLATHKVDLLALTAVPFGPDRAQFTLFPMSSESLVDAAKREGIILDGPHAAILVHGEDQVGAFAGVLSKVAAAGVNVFSAQGMTDGRGGFGYVLYVKPSDVDKALEALRKT
jgi:predicted amino acid-binding ACT domain protein